MEQMELEREPAPIPWWRRTLILQRSLIGTFSIGVPLVIYLGVVLALTKSSIASPSCETAMCIQQSYFLLENMNPKADPCDDFYEFACGGFIKKTQIPHYATEVGPATRLDNSVITEVVYEIDQPPLPTDIEPYVMLRNMYATCMDTTAIEKSGLDPIKSLLKNLGGWPILEMDSWVEIDWINLTQRLRQYGFNTAQFITIDVEVNLRNSTEYIVLIDKWNRIDDTLYPNFTNLLIQTAELFGAQTEFAVDEVDAVRKFRAKISKFVVSQSERYNITTIGEMQVQYPSIPWLDFLNVALAIPNVTLTNQTRVAVMSPTYIYEFESIMKQTPKRVQVNHALFEIIRSRINYLPNDIRKVEQEYVANATGVKRSKQRWYTCLNMVTDNFHVAADALYIRTYGNDNAREDVTEIVSNIKNAFVSRLKNIEWMDNATKARAIEKAEMITAHIGYPVELQNETYVLEYYKGLKFDSPYILEQIMQISKFKMDKRLSLYRYPVVTGKWNPEIPSFTTNALYSLRTNSIYIPFGIMQHEYYTFGRPMFMNYGGLGFVIAHEIVHGFDIDERWYNKIREVSSWWNVDAADTVAVKSQCLVEQYSNYTLPGSNLHLDGNRTLVENIADNGGVRNAYLAYLTWRDTHEEELPLPGLNLTDKQLFWVTFANTWCSKYRQSYQEQLLREEHAPYRFRILGSLSNMQYFANDFDCPLGSNMNPFRKCDLWK